MNTVSFSFSHLWILIKTEYCLQFDFTILKTYSNTLPHIQHFPPVRLNVTSWYNVTFELVFVAFVCLFFVFFWVFEHLCSKGNRPDSDQCVVVFKRCVKTALCGLPCHELLVGLKICFNDRNIAEPRVKWKTEDWDAENPTTRPALIST